MNNPERMNDPYMREALQRAFGDRPDVAGQSPDRLTPAQRTEVLFAQDVADLNKSLRRRVIGLVGSPKRLRVDQSVPYSKTPRDDEKEIGKNYIRGKEGKTVEELPAGTLWAFPLNHRKLKEGENVRQALVTAKDHDEKGGACVQITRVSKYNPETRQFDPMEREADMAVYFELDNNETANLQFLDDSEVLYVVRGQNQEVVEPPVFPNESRLDEANQYLKDLVGNN